MNIILYTVKTSPRLSYIVDFFSRQINDDPIIITTDTNVYRNTDAVKINYSGTPLAANEIQIKPHPLLFENNIQPQQTICFNWNGNKAFFATGCDFPFDMFAAAFYLVSRYEEYLPHEQDIYGRYSHTNSLAYRENFLHLPLVSCWIKDLLHIIQIKFPQRLQANTNARFHFLPTYDIDIAYCYKGKGFFRNTGGFFKDLFSFKTDQIADRVAVLTGLKNDPFDAYGWLDSLHDTYQLNPVYFYLLAGKTALYDKNIRPQSKEIKELIRHNKQKKYLAGIHPSWQSGDNPFLLKKEIALLKKYTAEDVLLCRQHYIRLSFPETYRILAAHGIQHDYSLGYGSINGFRASAALSFYWYDLPAEHATELMIHPFCFMEANSFFEQHYTAEEAGKELQQYYDIVRSVNGECIIIFHNHFLTEQSQWLPWRKMYAAFLQKNFSSVKC